MSKKFLILGALALSACGGGSDNTVGATFVAPTGPAAMLAQIDEANTLLTALNARDGSLESAIAPASANFDGVFLIARDANAPGDTYYGDVSLNVVLSGDGEISGSATNFYYYDTSGANGRTGQAVGGTIDVNAPEVGYDDPATNAREGFSIDLSGDLVMDGRSRNVTDSNVEAAFASHDDNIFANGSEGQIDMMVGDGTVTFGGTGKFDTFFLTCEASTDC